MPVNIMIGVLALLIALVFYSMGAIGAFRAKGVTQRQVTYLLIGFVFDVIATAMMAIQARGLDLSPLPDLVHTIVAFVGMFGMLAAAIMGFQAVKKADDKARASVAKWVLAPWIVWVFVFLWGMTTRGMERVGG